MKRFTLVVSLLAAIVISGCSTVMNGRNQRMTITSNVDSAELFLDGQRVGVTPFNGLVPRNKKMLMAQKAGFQTANVALSKSLEPAFWGNIIIGGTLGSITDFVSGAAYQYAPATYQVELRAAEQSEEDFKAQVALRGFAMIYLDEISRDLGRGSGDHLAALLTLANAGHPGSVTIPEIRDALTASAGSPVAFGRRITELK